MLDGSYLRHAHKSNAVETELCGFEKRTRVKTKKCVYLENEK